MISLLMLRLLCALFPPAAGDDNGLGLTGSVDGRLLGQAALDHVDVLTTSSSAAGGVSLVGAHHSVGDRRGGGCRGMDSDGTGRRTGRHDGFPGHGHDAHLQIVVLGRVVAPCVHRRVLEGLQIKNKRVILFDSSFLMDAFFPPCTTRYFFFLQFPPNISPSLSADHEDQFFVSPQKKLHMWQNEGDSHY